MSEVYAREHERYTRFIGQYGEKMARKLLGLIDETIWKKVVEDIKAKKKKPS